MYLSNINPASRSLTHSHTRSTSKGRGISLSQNNYASQNNQEDIVNITVYVDSISLKQPKINISCILKPKQDGFQNIPRKRREKGNEPTQRINPLRDISLNKSVYLGANTRVNSPGISLSLLENKSTLKQEKVEYKRKSVAIQQSKMFQTAIMQPQTISTPIKHRATPLGGRLSLKTTPLKRSIFRQMTQY